jgi:hypothetical protein
MKGNLARGAMPRLVALVLWTALCAPCGLLAQTTTGTLRGKVKDETGGTLPGASVEAVNDDTGFRLGATTGADGFFNLSVQPGPYTVTATLPSFTTDTKKTRVLVGQTQGIDFELKLAARAAEAVTVTSEAPVIETKSNELATNVSEQQIRQLPQDNRNFLSFAALAPGVRYNDSDLSKTITAGAVDGNAVNVFIDGTSFKNDVLMNGIAGQDSSRGNPFPQNAVQEFRVISQNFKAEYEKSSSAIVTAVTKSGGNDFHADAFGEYQNKGLVAFDDCSQTTNGRCGSPHVPNATKPDYTRYQAGFDMGGPIVKDSVHFFVSYELNDQNRANNVAIGSQDQAKLVPPAILSQLQSQVGNFTAPFRSNLAFAKLSWQAGASDIVDTSGYYRKEHEIRDFGGQTSITSANDIENGVWNAQVKNTMLTSSYMSETTVSYNNYRWNPRPSNPNLIGENFENVLQIGGGSNHQDFDQKRFTIREDFSVLNLKFAGDHVVKAGAYGNANNYDVKKYQDDNPIFDFNSNPQLGAFQFPYQAFFGFGNPNIGAHNNQYGVYLQDDWSVSSRLTVNVGLRWDYETDALNNNYVTPANVISELSGKVPANYFTDGTQRPNYKNEFQPRIGFTYDLTGKGKTILFGGYGRYFDRDTYNYGLDERYRLQYEVLQFQFSSDGLPRNGSPTIVWNPSYLSVAGLQGLVASGLGPKPQVFLINNGTKPPVTDEFSLGVRQQVGVVGLSASYAGSRSRNGYTYIWNNFPCCVSPAPDFSQVLLSDADKRGWYDALLVSANKAYTSDSRWGASLAYTYSHATATGGDLFSLDYVNVAAYPRHRAQFDERHRIVLSGIVGLPWDTRLSTLITLGTGLGYNLVYFDYFGPGLAKVLNYDGFQKGTFPYQDIDLQLGKDFQLGGGARVGFTVGVFNLTNHDNIDPGSINGNFFKGPNGPIPDVVNGTGGALLTQPRRLQLGLTVGF